MANIKSFPNNRDEYVGAEYAMRWLHGRTSGVFAANNNAAVAAVQNAMAVTVSDGIGWISDSDKNGVVWWNDAEKNKGAKMQLTIDAADGVMNRIDRVIVEWKTTDYADLPEIKILKGTPASVAAAPSLTNNTTKRQISLAKILVAAGTTSITASMITDERQNPDVCGLVTDTLSIDTSVINAQFTELLDQLRAAIEQAGSGQLADGTVTTAKLANKAVTAAKLADDAKYWDRINRTNTDELGTYITKAWGHLWNYCWGQNQTFTMDSAEFARLDTFWESILYAAGEGMTVTLTDMPNIINVETGEICGTTNTFTIPIRKTLWLKKLSTTVMLVGGSFSRPTIKAGTGSPTGGSDGDIYIQYS